MGVLMTKGAAFAKANSYPLNHNSTATAFNRWVDITIPRVTPQSLC